MLLSLVPLGGAGHGNYSVPPDDCVAICRRSFLSPWIRTVSGGLVAGGFEGHRLFAPQPCPPAPGTAVVAPHSAQPPRLQPPRFFSSAAGHPPAEAL